ncbi:anti-sigma regulatory factor (Ser/Thr protein kinase) [Streptacidiphilus sp. MAP12-16]|uniref:ATP-binding protein n=1 Tax=Streptacidiphilus sp. MAP12-16 TaxID=3156300 RepID=UPI0035132590
MNKHRSPQPHRTLLAWNRDTVSPAAQAREHLRPCLVGLGITEDRIEDALVMVTELVSNTRHAQGPYQLRVRRTQAEAIIEVQDRTSAVPELVERAPSDLLAHCGAGPDALLGRISEGGRGLQIVDSLSMGCWGFRVYPGFKISWYALALPPRF